MKNLKKIVSITLAAVVLFTLSFSMNVLAADTTYVEKTISIIKTDKVRGSLSAYSDMVTSRAEVSSGVGGPQDTYNSVKFIANFKEAAPNARKLLDFNMGFDHCYYGIENAWSQTNPRTTPMIWDNVQKNWVLPNPWQAVNKEGTAEEFNTAKSAAGGTDGVRIILTDVSPNVTGASDLTYILKSELSDLASDTSENVDKLNKNNNMNIVTPSNTALDSEIYGFRYDVETAPKNTNIVKQLRLVQHKFSEAYWHMWNFSMLYKIVYQEAVTIKVENPKDVIGLPVGEKASFNSSVEGIDIKDCQLVWQVSKDKGLTYTDLISVDEPTLSFATTNNDDGNYYRIKVIPNGAKAGEEIYSEGAELQLINKTSNVIVKHIDADGKEVAESITLSGLVGEHYTAQRLTLDDYEFDSVIGAETGVFENETMTVTFVYKEKEKLTNGDSNTINPPPPPTGQNNALFLLFSILIIAAIAAGTILYRNKAKIEIE